MGSPPGIIMVRMQSPFRIVIDVAIGFLGAFSPLLSIIAPGTAIATLLLGPIATGSVVAATSGRAGLPWLLLGFSLPAILVVGLNALWSPPTPATGEGSGSEYVFVIYSRFGFVLAYLGFYGWLGVRHIAMSRNRQATPDKRER